MKVRDNRTTDSKNLGDIITVCGDISLGFFNTDCGYRLIVDTYNLKQISDFYLAKNNKKEVQDGQ